MIRKINVKTVTKAIKKLAIDTNNNLCNDVCERICEFAAKETFPVAKDIMSGIQENISVAKQRNIPLCQDTGIVCIFMEIGQNVHFIGGNLEDAINEGVRQGYKDGYLRKSVVNDPFERKNTDDNTPAVINYKIVPGDKAIIKFAPKGFGSENMSRIKMLPPAAGVDAVKAFVVQVCQDAGANPCPPTVVGVGIGGTFDSAALMAKEALLEPLDADAQNDFYKVMEDELLNRINKLGIGPQGFGGKTTALAVKIKAAPTHIAGLPVAVNINCHVSRHGEIIL